MGRRAGARPDGLNLSPLRRRAALVLWTELLVHGAAPSAAVLTAYVVLAIFGLGNGWVFLAALALAAAALGWEAAKIRPPASAAIDRRIELASGLKHRPLAALADAPALGGTEIWAAHLARMEAALAGARTGWPAPFAVAKDPFSLRALLLLLLAVGAVVAGPDKFARLGADFAPPAWPFAGPEQTAWLTPPAYTDPAPRILNPGERVTALLGSQITVIENGTTGPIRFAGAALPLTVLGDASRRADGVIAGSGTLTVGPWWHRLARWRIDAVAPSAPSVTLGPVALIPRGIGLSWHSADDYGLSTLEAAIHPLGYPDALPEGVALPAALGDGGARLETTDSPYGGVAVGVVLTAVNLAWRMAHSASQTVTLPGMPLHDSTAVVLSIARQNLALMPGQQHGIGAQLSNLAAAPPSAISYAVDVQIAALGAALRMQAVGPAEGVDRLLALIKQVEAGPDFGPGQALAQANAVLLRALAHGPPDAAMLARLLAQLHQALAAHLNAIRPAQGNTKRGRMFDPSTLDKLAQKIAADEQAGRTAQAQAEMRQLEAALQAIQNAQPMNAQQAAQAQAAGQAVQQLSNLMHGQASLLNKTTQGNGTPAEQAGLQARLNAIQSALGKAGLPSLPGLGAAGHAMQNAQNALGSQDEAGAEAAEASALQNMQKAAAALQKASEQGMALGPGGQMPDPMPGEDDPNGDSEDLFSPGLMTPGANPADAIQQEIIHLDADPSLPAATHDYLRRLLTPDP